jgi:hypothetical protein
MCVRTLASFFVAPVVHAVIHAADGTAQTTSTHPLPPWIVPPTVPHGQVC